MSISFELPVAVEEQLRRDHADLDVVAKEAALVELYRQGRISQHQLGLSLDKSRFEVEELLKRHNVTEDLGTAEQVAEQITILRRLLLSQTNADLTP
jgi:predicted HTH domain antitoxin